MTNLPGAVREYWAEYLAALPPDHAHRGARPDAFAFGNSAALADELAELVLAGRKRATTSLPVEFEAAGDPLPCTGAVGIILDGRRLPVAIVEFTSVTTVAFGAVDADYAAVEGEGDGSLRFWRKAHTEYFTDVCRRLGGRFDETTPVICQVFRVVWPVEVAAR
jgi:uncharacterized protein YhfF